MRLTRNLQGYDPDHKDIELLRLRSFTISKQLSDDEVLHADSLTRISELISCLLPFVSVTCLLLFVLRYLWDPRRARNTSIESAACRINIQDSPGHHRHS